jgi:hypothetical protein
MAKEAGTTLASSTDARLALPGQALRRRAAEADAREGEERVAGKVGIFRLERMPLCAEQITQTSKGWLERTVPCSLTYAFLRLYDLPVQKGDS